MDAVEKFVRQILPKVTDSEVANLLKIFEELGLETIEDIPRIKESELEGTLKPLQIRRLIQISIRCNCPACQPKASESAARPSGEAATTEGESSDQTEVDEPSTACPGVYYTYSYAPAGYGGYGGCQPSYGGG